MMLPEQRDRPSVVPEADLGNVRLTVASLYANKHKVTLDTLLAALQEQGFQWSRSTLYRTLLRMGFSCSKSSSHYSRLKEKESVIAQRVRYIQEIQELREDGYIICYTDETWANKNLVPEKQRLDEEGKGGGDAPGGKGTRFIIAHVGSRECGLLPDAMYCVAVNYNKESEDYHNSMNGEIYLQWLRETVFPRMREHFGEEAKLTLVLDKATYHRTLTDDTSRTWKKLKKADLITFLIGRGVPADVLPPHAAQTMLALHALTLDVVGPPKYEVQRLAEEFGIKVVYLPVAHPELNPIKKVWGAIKNIVMSRNGTVDFQDEARFTMSALNEHLECAVRKVSASMWEGFEDECISAENTYLELADVEEALDSGDEDEDEDVDGL